MLERGKNKREKSNDVGVQVAAVLGGAEDAPATSTPERTGHTPSKKPGESE